MDLVLLLVLPLLLISVVAHEVAHAWVARREGDYTADRLGRITLNPLRHLDLWGSFLVPALLWAGGGILFGWAKPVPVDPRNFRSHPWSDIRVSLAGIVVNLGLAVGFTVLAAVAAWTGSQWSTLASEAGFVEGVFRLGIFLNLILAFFNLLPIPPLDGSHVVVHALPPRLRPAYRSFGRFGILVLMAVVFLVPEGIAWLLAPVDALMGVADSFVRLWI